MTTIDRDRTHDHDQDHGQDHGQDHDHPHAHGHGHGHDHPHRHDAERYLSGAGTSERAFGGPVTVDIGNGAGALVLLLDDDWLEDEVHLRPLNGGGPSTHTGVWVRKVPSGDVVAAVFGSLPRGTYAVFDHDCSTVMVEIEVPDGRVVDIDLRGQR